VPWGEKALGGYLGDDRAPGAGMMPSPDRGRRARAELLVDVGEPTRSSKRNCGRNCSQRACADAGIALTLRRQPGYDHSYYFISTFMADHLRWHAERLTGD
jgi:S-formylglutathione hydrolase